MCKCLICNVEMADHKSACELCDELRQLKNDIKELLHEMDQYVEETKRASMYSGNIIHRMRAICSAAIGDK